jgi:hypothetical protein
MRIITASLKLENMFTGRDSQRACHQDELIDDKALVVK